MPPRPSHWLPGAPTLGAPRPSLRGRALKPPPHPLPRPSHESRSSRGLHAKAATGRSLGASLWGPSGLQPRGAVGRVGPPRCFPQPCHPAPGGGFGRVPLRCERPRTLTRQVPLGTRCSPCCGSLVVGSCLFRDFEPLTVSLPAKTLLLTLNLFY